MAVTDLVAKPFADALLACLCTAVAQETNPPQFCCLRYGTAVNSGRDECECGVAWVRLGDVYPTTVFPARADEPILCPTGYAVELEMGILRCAPTGGPFSAASCEEWTALSVDLSEDDAAMRQALCCFTAGLEADQWVDLGSSPLDTEGGCAGRIHSLLVQSYCIPC
jgi:hypothetical protein